MSKLKTIKLVNYCGYKNFDLDLSDGNDVRRWSIFYGPNGCGKSNFIRAVELLSLPMAFTKKKNILTFRKLKHHNDYIYGAETMYSDVNDLYMEATFVSNGVDKRVILEDNIKGVLYAGRTVDESKGEISGVKLNELDIIEQGVIFIDADCRNMMQKFQIISSLKEQFCDFASSVYGFNCYCPEGAKVVDHGIEYITDFVIEKYSGTKVHYKRFSDGEKKIATLISSLFKRGYKDSPDRENKDIVVVDNIEMHIYWKRHMKLLEKIEEYFPDKQIIATTHSPIIINNLDKKYLCDLEELLK
jgi:AAA15 family ATPase/GTPase